MKPVKLCGFLRAMVFVIAGLFAGSSGLHAQLILENSGSEPRAGEVVELSVPSPDQGLSIHAVRVGQRSVPFELVDPGGDRPLRKPPCTKLLV